MRAAGDAILLLVAEAATVGLANYLVAQLDAASAAAAGIPAGLAAVEAAGFSPDLIVGSRSAIATELPGATPAAYPAIVYGPTGSAIYVRGARRRVGADRRAARVDVRRAGHRRARGVGVRVGRVRGGHGRRCESGGGMSDERPTPEQGIVAHGVGIGLELAGLEDRELARRIMRETAAAFAEGLRKGEAARAAEADEPEPEGSRWSAPFARSGPARRALAGGSTEGRPWQIIRRDLGEVFYVSPPPTVARARVGQAVGFGLARRLRRELGYRRDVELDARLRRLGVR